MKISRIGEFGLTERISSQIKNGPAVIKGIGDDTAVLKFKKDKYLLFTTDMLIEDVHFKLKRAIFFKIGWKALCCSLSDIAAMGGIPSFALISIGLPEDFEVEFVDEIYKGINKAAKEFKVDIVGGDMDFSEKLIINVALMGELEKENLCLRRGAKVGDRIFVTGELGASKKGRHLEFTPRIKEARWLVCNFKIHSMIDISDGLIQDLSHILKQAGLGAVLYKERIPISKDADSFEEALTYGEDFELLFTVSKKEAERLKNGLYRRPFKTKINQIGEVVKGGEWVKLLEKSGKTKVLDLKGYRHF